MGAHEPSPFTQTKLAFRQKVLDLFKQGLTARQISERTGKSPQHVTKIKNRYGTNGK
jgi:transposase